MNINNSRTSHVEVRLLFYIQKPIHIYVDFLSLIC